MSFKQLEKRSYTVNFPTNIETKPKIVYPHYIVFASIIIVTQHNSLTSAFPFNWKANSCRLL